MSLRLKCSNGHALDGPLLHPAARSGRCPTCKAAVLVWVKVVCSAGHRLKLWARPRGGQGSCPHCQQSVVVPTFDLERLVEKPRQPAPKPRVSDSSTVLSYDELGKRIGARTIPLASDEFSFEYLPESTFDESTITVPCRFCGVPRSATEPFCPVCGQR